tara:strand:- start:407 stop:616 length:210 start_codon:yes stop_codon:yes gene_type:complete
MVFGSPEALCRAIFIGMKNASLGTPEDSADFLVQGMIGAVNLTTPLFLGLVSPREKSKGFRKPLAGKPL